GLMRVYNKLAMTQPKLVRFDGKRILLVDDDPNFRPALEATLRALGFTVTTAVNGREAYAILQSSLHDAVVSDIRMPEMDGVELTRLIKQRGRVPVVLMTGFSDLVETRDAFNYGADEFIP